MKPSERLLAAKNLLIERGWTQGISEKDDGPLCQIGARIQSGEELALSSSENSLLREVVGLAWSYGGTNWNDAPGRTEQEVLDVFDKAIALAKDRGL